MTKGVFVSAEHSRSPPLQLFFDAGYLGPPSPALRADSWNAKHEKALFGHKFSLRREEYERRLSMDKFIAVIFPDEAKAYEGKRALNELNDEGSITLYGTAVLTRDADGSVNVKDTATEGPVGTAVGVLTGGLVGLLGGPAGVAVGLTGGGMLGSLTDILNLGVRSDFLDRFSSELSPGKTALVAEIQEDWVIPLDTRMQSIGGDLLRVRRAEFEDQQVCQEVEERKEDIAQLQQEFAQAREENKTKLKARMDDIKQKLDAASERVRARTEQMQNEADAKIKSLQDQASKASDEAKSKIDTRISEVKASNQRRMEKLKQAWQLAKEALAA